MDTPGMHDHIGFDGAQDNMATIAFLAYYARSLGNSKCAKMGVMILALQCIWKKFCDKAVSVRRALKEKEEACVEPRKQLEELEEGSAPVLVEVFGLASSEPLCVVSCHEGSYVQEVMDGTKAQLGKLQANEKETLVWGQHTLRAQDLLRWFPGTTSTDAAPRKLKMTRVKTTREEPARRVVLSWASPRLDSLEIRRRSSQEKLEAAEHGVRCERQKLQEALSQCKEELHCALSLAASISPKLLKTPCFAESFSLLAQQEGWTPTDLDPADHEGLVQVLAKVHGCAIHLGCIKAQKACGAACPFLVLDSSKIQRCLAWSLEEMPSSKQPGGVWAGYVDMHNRNPYWSWSEEKEEQITVKVTKMRCAKMPKEDFRREPMQRQRLRVPKPRESYLRSLGTRKRNVVRA